MGKKIKKKGRSGVKEKRIPNSAPRVVPKENKHNYELLNNGSVAEKENNACVHLEKFVDLGQVSSKIESAESTGCEDCRQGMIDRKGGKGKSKHGKKKGTSDSKATWICLQCGHFSCGGIGLPTNHQMHATLHARQSRHPLVIQVENPHLRWCFSCRMLIGADKSEGIGEEKDVLSDLVKLLKKQSSKSAPGDVVDIWFGSGSVVSDVKSENKAVNLSVGKDYYAVRGLVNLGNTCFFNSVMQNLLAIDILREYLLKFDGSMGPLTSALKKVYVESSPESGLKGMINPRSLFGCVCIKAPQFRGYQQQDSHELLRCLLDGLSTEDLSAKKSDNSTQENGASLPVSSTFIDFIFGGEISSTVCCVECGHFSVVYESFLDLSLSVPTKKPTPKKAQPVYRTKTTKPPPKRVGRTRPKLNNDDISGLAVSGCNPSISSSSGSKGVSDSSLSAHLAEFGNVVDCNVLGSQRCQSTQVDDATSDVQEANDEAWLDYLVPVTEGGAQESDTWLDFLGPMTPDDQNTAVENEDAFVSQDSVSKGVNVDTVSIMESSCEVSAHSEGKNVDPQSTRDDCDDEHPLQVKDNEILLLTYKEDDATAMCDVMMNAEISSSNIDDGEDTLGFIGPGNLFDEPEPAAPLTTVSTNVQASTRFGNGFLAGNNTESDPDEVDNMDSPVSVESCLAQFVKPELLSGEHAWHCENCTKVVQEGRRRLKKKQMKSELELQGNVPNDECSSSEVVEFFSHPSLECSSIVLTTHNNGNSVTDETLKRCDRLQINGPGSDLPQKQEESCEPEVFVGHSLSDESGLGGKPTNSNGCADDVSVEILSRPDEHESAEDDDNIDAKSVKVMRDATKRILISKTPPILTIHLKRFGQDAHGRLSKLNGHVVFKEFIDLRPYMDHRSTETGNCIYRLVGVVEHSGSMRGGHYVAYVRGGDRHRLGSEEESHLQRHSVWYHASDAYVRETTLEEVLHSEAYILFYEKLQS